MRVEIITKKENPLLKRQDVEFIVKETKITPSREELRKQISAQTNSNEKNVVVGVLETNYGSTETKGIARIYKSNEDLKKTELEHIIKRNFKAEEKKEEAPKAEATPAPEGAKEEAKATETSEEKKE